MFYPVVSSILKKKKKKKEKKSEMCILWPDTCSAFHSLDWAFALNILKQRGNFSVQKLPNISLIHIVT